MNFLVFTDDWGRHPSSCQHLMRFFLREERFGHNVIIWMNTIGTRPPRLDMLTLKRGFEKLFHWAKWKKNRSTKEEKDELCPVIYNPLMYPWFRQRVDRKINRFFLQHAVRKALRHVSGPVTAITTLPIVADLVGATFQDSPISRWVYYCVDDWSQWPGADAATMEKMEKELLPKVDCVICAGVALQERLKTLGRESSLLTHGVDIEHWHFEQSVKESALDAFQNLPEDSRLAEFFQDIPRPFFTFWGLIDERLDLEMVRRLADDVVSGTLIFAGPSASQRVISELKHPKIRLVGKLAYRELPLLARCSDVLIMPYRNIPVTQQMQPLKMTEYLASGRPAVVRRLPACEAWADALDMIETPEDFSLLVRLRVESGLPECQRAARERLKDESWEAKAAEFERMMGGRESGGGEMMEPDGRNKPQA